MSAPAAAHTFNVTALSWTKRDIDALMDQARQSVQEYVENGEQQEHLRACIAVLHQAAGTLEVIQTPTPSLVLRTMERLGQALLDRRVADRAHAFGLLFQGIVQVPDYLEYIMSGHRDVPEVLMPLVNDMRRLIGDSSDLNVALAFPVLNAQAPRHIEFDSECADPDVIKPRAEYMHALFRGYMNRWANDDDRDEALEGLAMVCDQMVPSVRHPAARHLFWLAGACFDALRHGHLKETVELKHAMSQVEAQLRDIAQGGQAAADRYPPSSLVRHLLFVVFHDTPTPTIGRLAEIATAFDPSAHQPTAQERDLALAAMGGRNRTALANVATAVKEDLSDIKDGLDQCMRLGVKGSEMAPHITKLGELASTLSMIGLVNQSQAVAKQKMILHDITTASNPPEDWNDMLLDIAAELLAVEISVDSQVHQATSMGTGLFVRSPGAHEAETEQAFAVLLKEATVNFGHAKQALVTYVSSHHLVEHLKDVPRLFDEVSGALKMIGDERSIRPFAQVRTYITVALMEHAHKPSTREVNRLADAITALEYHIEALRDRQPHAHDILDVVHDSISDLMEWAPADIVFDRPATIVSSSVLIPPNDADRPADEPEAKSVEAQPADLPEHARPHGALIVPFDGDSGVDIDDEIREIFAEELGEELDSLVPLHAGLSPLTDHSHIKNIRKSFHTIKGSAKMMGAFTLGDLAGGMEVVYNRVLDGNRPMSTAVADASRATVDHIKMFRLALSGGSHYWDLPPHMAWLSELASGKDTPRATSSTQSPAPRPAPETTAGASRIEHERLEQAQLEQAQLEQAQLEQDRLEQDRLEQAQLEQAQLEQEQNAQRARESLAQELLNIEQRAQEEQEEQARLANERAERDRLEQEQAERTRHEQEWIEQERLEQERRAQERLAQEQEERLARERLILEQMEAQRLEEERAENDRIEQARRAEEEAARALEADRQAQAALEEQRAAHAAAEIHREAQALVQAQRLAEAQEKLRMEHEAQLAIHLQQEAQAALEEQRLTEAAEQAHRDAVLALQLKREAEEALRAAQDPVLTLSVVEEDIEMTVVPDMSLQDSAAALAMEQDLADLFARQTAELEEEEARMAALNEAATPLPLGEWADPDRLPSATTIHPGISQEMSDQIERAAETQRQRAAEAEARAREILEQHEKEEALIAAEEAAAAQAGQDKTHEIVGQPIPAHWTNKDIAEHIQTLVRHMVANSTSLNDMMDIWQGNWSSVGPDSWEECALRSRRMIIQVKKLVDRQNQIQADLTVASASLSRSASTVRPGPVRAPAASNTARAGANPPASSAPSKTSWLSRLFRR